MSVTVTFPDGTRRATGRPGVCPLRRCFDLGPEGGVIRFSTTAKPARVPPDPRPLYFQVRNAKLTGAR